MAQTDPYEYEKQEMDLDLQLELEKRLGGDCKPDPDEWVWDESWQNDASECWSNWSGWRGSSSKQEADDDWQSNQWEDWPKNAAAAVEGEADGGAEDDDDDDDDYDEEESSEEWPEWASKGHAKNNELRDGKRGSYGHNAKGKPVFQAKPEFGGKQYAPGRGRKRGRHRGRESVKKQRKKQEEKHKGKGKGKAKGCKGKGKSKGKWHDGSNNGLGAAVSTMSVMANSTNKLIDLMIGQMDTAASSSSSSPYNRQQWTKVKR